jgi:hypothetical protein
MSMTKEQIEGSDEETAQLRTNRIRIRRELPLKFEAMPLVVALSQKCRRRGDCIMRLIGHHRGRAIQFCSALSSVVYSSSPSVCFGVRSGSPRIRRLRTLLMVKAI